MITLQEQTYGYSVPDSFYPWNCEQRMRWFKRVLPVRLPTRDTFFSLSDSEL